ncbi:MAG TPA: hypothetical protein DIU15_19190, partial [Deltaproteobacteria bacterium]|nr:hypothetical protein [Deltaproteobacteria bacterium]
GSALEDGPEDIGWAGVSVLRECNAKPAGDEVGAAWAGAETGGLGATLGCDDSTRGTPPDWSEAAS